jgi:hypothetical protein
MKVVSNQQIILERFESSSQLSALYPKSISRRLLDDPPSGLQPSAS